MVDKLILTNYVYICTENSVSYSDLLGSQNNQNYIFFTVLLLLAGVIGYMFSLIYDGFSSATEERNKGFSKVAKEIEEMKIMITELKAIMMVTKAVELGVTTDQVLDSAGAIKDQLSKKYKLKEKD